MIQTFDECFSFLDSAKNAIERFIRSKVQKINNTIEREENSAYRDKDKEDRFLLLTTSEENPVISKWDDPIEHFLFQLRALKVK